MWWYLALQISGLTWWLVIMNYIFLGRLYSVLYIFVNRYSLRLTNPDATNVWSIHLYQMVKNDEKRPLLYSHPTKHSNLSSKYHPKHHELYDVFPTTARWFIHIYAIYRWFTVFDFRGRNPNFRRNLFKSPDPLHNPRVPRVPRTEVKSFQVICLESNAMEEVLVPWANEIPRNLPRCRAPLSSYPRWMNRWLWEAAAWLGKPKELDLLLKK